MASHRDLLFVIIYNELHDTEESQGRVTVVWFSVPGSLNMEYPEMASDSFASLASALTIADIVLGLGESSST